MGNKGGQALWRGVSIPTLSLEAKASIWVTEQTPGGNPAQEFCRRCIESGTQKGTAGGVGRSCHSHRNCKHIVHSSLTKALLSPTRVCFH